MSDFLQELRDHWDDSYWWADHQIVLAVLLGLIAVAFHGLQIWMSRKWGPEDG